MTEEEKTKTCGTCARLVTEFGKPYYCAIRDLYTFKEEDEEACEEWVGVKKNDRA